MSEYTPTAAEAFDATIYTWVDWKGRYPSTEAAEAAWDRMIAEVQREAAEKAWGEGYGAGVEDARQADILQVGIGLGTGTYAQPARQNPYRRNEGENE